MVKYSKKKRQDAAFSFNFSFRAGEGRREEEREIPKLSCEPAAFDNAEAMADRLNYSKDYFCLVSGSFIFGDFLEALVFKKRLIPNEMYITTLGMSQDNIDSIVNIADYLGCKKVNLLVSHYFYGVERHKLVPYMQREFSGKPIDVAVLQSHCKIALIFSEQGDVLISGSANLSSSNNVEQFIIMHDPTAIAYVKARLDNIMDRFTVYHGLESKATPKSNTGNTGKNAFEAMKGDNI